MLSKTVWAVTEDLVATRMPPCKMATLPVAPVARMRSWRRPATSIACCRFLRFPGGCYVEGDTLAHSFRWKNSVGPSAERRGHWNLWGYWSTDGEHLTWLHAGACCPSVIWVSQHTAADVRGPVGESAGVRASGRMEA